MSESRTQLRGSFANGKIHITEYELTDAPQPLFNVFLSQRFIHSLYIAYHPAANPHRISDIYEAIRTSAIQKIVLVNEVMQLEELERSIHTYSRMTINTLRSLNELDITDAIFTNTKDMVKTAHNYSAIFSIIENCAIDNIYLDLDQFTYENFHGLCNAISNAKKIEAISFRNLNRLTSEKMGKLCIALKNTKIKLSLKFILLENWPTEDYKALIVQLKNNNIPLCDLSRIDLTLLDDDQFELLCGLLGNTRSNLNLKNTNLRNLPYARLERFFTALGNSDVKKIDLHSLEIMDFSVEGFALLCNIETKTGRRLLELTNFIPKDMLEAPYFLNAEQRTKSLRMLNIFIFTQWKEWSNFNELNFSGIDLSALTDDDVATLCHILKHAPLTLINLSETSLNKLSAENFRTIFKALSESAITDLILANNNLAELDNEKEWILFNFIRRSRLRNLVLRNNRFGYYNATVFAELCESIINSAIKTVDLTDNELLRLKEEGMSSVCHLIKDGKLDTLRIFPYLLLDESNFGRLCDALSKSTLVSFSFYDHIVQQLEITYLTPAQKKMLENALKYNFYLRSMNGFEHDSSWLKDAFSRLFARYLKRNHAIFKCLMDIDQMCQVILKGTEELRPISFSFDFTVGSERRSSKETFKKFNLCSIGKIVSRIRSKIAKLPPEAEHFIRLLNEGIANIYCQAAERFKNEKKYEFAIQAWLNVPSVSKRFQASRIEAFSLAYNGYYNDLADAHGAFVKALPFITDNGTFIRFEPFEQNKIDACLLRAAGIKNDREFIDSLTATDRFRLLKFVLLREMYSLHPQKINLKTITHLSELPENLDRLWSDIYSPTYTLLKDENLFLVLDIVSNPFNNPNALIKLQNYDDFIDLCKNLFPASKGDPTFISFQNLNRDHVLRFVQLAKTFLITYIEDGIKNNSKNTLIEAEKSLFHLLKLNSEYKNPDKHSKNADDSLLVTAITDINTYMKMRALETWRFSFLTFLFGFSGKDYYERRQHWCSVLTLLKQINQPRNNNDALNKAMSEIDAGIKRFGSHGRGQYADLLLKLKFYIECLGDSVQKEVSRIPAQKLIHTSQHVFDEQRAVTNTVKTLHSSPDNKKMAKARLHHNLFSYRLQAKDRPAFLSKDELKKSELINVRSGG